MNEPLTLQTAKIRFFEDVAGPALRQLWLAYVEDLVRSGAIPPELADLWAPPERKRAPKRP